MGGDVRTVDAEGVVTVGSANVMVTEKGFAKVAADEVLVAKFCTNGSTS